MKTLYTQFRKLAFVSFLTLSSITLTAQTDVLVCGAASPQTWLDDVQNKLVATGAFNSVATYNTYLTGTPTLAYMQGFDAILVFTDYGCQDPVTFGNNLSQYIDGGGGVVNCVFSNASVPIGGNFNTTPYQVIVPVGGQNSSPQLTLGTILEPCHATIQGITSFDGGTSSYRSNSNTLAPGAQFIANWSNGEWLVAARENVGPLNVRRADLNFYPPSSTVRSDFWDATTQGAQLMANALLWVANVTNNLTAPATPGAITGNIVVCEAADEMYSISTVPGATSYNWTAPLGGVIQSGQGTVSITLEAGATSGNLSVTAVNACGASSPSEIALTINTLPVLSGTTDSVNCFGGSDGNIDLSVTGNSGFTYGWSNSSVSEDISGLIQGTYSVVVTDTNNCTSTMSFDIYEPTAIMLSSSQVNDTCYGIAAGSIDLIVSGGSPGYTYSWSNAEVTEDINNLAANNYIVTVTDIYGCTNTHSATITEPTAITANFTTTMSTCNGDTDGSATVVAGGGNGGAYTYLWETSDITDFINNVGAGIYSVTIGDVMGCTFTDSVEIMQPDTLIASYITVNVNCNGSADGSIQAIPAGGNGQYSYDWSNSETTDLIDNLAPGTYYLTLMDSAGCTYSDSVVITEPPALLLSGTVINETLGNDGSIDLTVSGGTPLYTFDWSNSATTEDINGLAAGVYTVIVEDGNSCTDTIEFTVVSYVGLESEQTLQTLIYPNPSNGVFTLSVDPNMALADLTITTVTGAIIYSARMQSFEQMLDFSTIAKGIYYLRVSSGNSISVKQLIIR